MYEWSKELVDKIEKAQCLSKKELRMVELALRMSEIHSLMLNECAGISSEDKYELKHKF